MMQRVWHCSALLGNQGVWDIRTVRWKVWSTWRLSSTVQYVCEWNIQGWIEQRENWFLAQVAFGEGHHRWE